MATLGFSVSKLGIPAVPTAGLVVLFILLFSSLTINSSFEKYTSDYNNTLALNQDIIKKKINLKEFTIRHKFFMVFAFSILFVFFQNAIINNYLIQIIRGIGGDSSQMGSLFSFMAILELPGLFFFTKLRRRFSCQFMLKVAAIAFIVKVFLTYLATSVFMIYIAFLFQLISFPIYLSASVHLVDEVMDKGEAIKGQALVTGMMTLSGVYANLIGGFILDLKGPSTLLLLSTFVTIAGTFIMFIVIDRIKKIAI